MPRNAQGVYTLPAGNPVVAGTLIETTWANPTMSDIAAALTGSLPRDGSAPMTGPLILSHDATLPLEATTLQQLNNSLGAQSNYTPAGTVQLFAMSAIPTGWLECNGAAVSRTTYANLFAVIGTTYGAGNGTTTFNVPDLRGQFIRGWDHDRSIDPGRVLGSTQASANQAHQHAATVVNPVHSHAVTDPGHNHTLTDPGHTHLGQVGVGTGTGAAGGSGIVQGAISSAPTGVSIAATTTGLAVSAAIQNTSVVVESQGSEARPTNVAMVYCIRAYGALQTDGLGSMAFQNKDAVDITGGAGVFTTLQCTTAPVSPNDVARLADIGGSIAQIFSADPQVLTVDNTSPATPILRPQVNMPNGMCKLDAAGYVPSDVLNVTDLTFLGTFSALAGTLPSGVFATGDYYQIDVAGTLTLHTSGGTVAQPCNVGDQIIYNMATPGWWYTPAAVASALPATAISFTPEGTIVAVNVQAAITELDGETQTALLGKAPTSAGTAIGTTFTPAAGISATNVQAAIQEVVADLSVPKPGEVLQVVTHFDVGLAQSTSNWVSLTPTPASITPKSTNSTLIVECCFNGTVAPVVGVNAEGIFQINNGSVPSGIGGNYVLLSSPSAGGGIGASGGVALQWPVANTTLATKSFAMTAFPNAGSPNILGAQQQAWKITEVQN